MANYKVLLVEDNPDDEALTLRALSRNNIRANIFVVRDGVEALDYFFCQNKYADRDPQDLPHLILLDIKLPKLDGLEVLRRIRADERTRLVPVVSLTSSKEEQESVRRLQKQSKFIHPKTNRFHAFRRSDARIALYWLVLNVDRRLLRNILRNPGAYYVNVHNEEFPASAVRGQLSSPEE